MTKSFLAFIFICLSFPILGQQIHEFCTIKQNKDTLDHGDKFSAIFRLRSQYLKDSSSFTLKISGHAFPEFKDGQILVEFPVVNYDKDVNSKKENEATLTLDYLGETYETTFHYWVKVNPAYNRAYSSTKPLSSFVLFPDKRPLLKGDDLESIIVENFNLSNKHGVLVITYIVDKQGKLNSLEIAVNSFSDINYQNLKEYLGRYTFKPGLLDSELINTLDYLVINR